MGCFISHIRLFKKLIDSDLDFVVIFEDDAEFCEDFEYKFKKCLSEIKKNMDGVLYFGGRFDPNFQMPAENYLNFSESISQHKLEKDVKLDSLETVMWSARTTHGYIIFKNTAKKIYDIFTKLPNIDSAIDHWMLLILINNNIDVYDTIPLLCYCPFINDSDIR